MVRRESENKDGNRPLRRFASQYARTEGLDVRVEGGEHLTFGFNAAAKSAAADSASSLSSRSDLRTV